MILLALHGCAPWIFDARVWDCDDDVTVESGSELTLRATDEDNGCRVRAEGLSRLNTSRSGDALFLTNARNVELEGAANLYTQWEGGGSASLIEVERESADLRLLSEGSGRLFLDEFLEINCENCSLRGDLYTDFEIELLGSGTSSICVREGAGRIQFGSGILELHGNLSGVEVQGGGVLLTSWTDEEVPFDVPAMGRAPAGDCESTFE